MSDFRRLLESLDSIAEAFPKGLPPRAWEVTPLEGGKGGGGGGFGGGGGGGRVAPVSPPPAAPSQGAIGQGVGSAKPKIERLPGETPAQAVARAQAARPLPTDVAPGTAGAGRGTVNPSEIKPLPKTGVLRQNPDRAEQQARQAQQNVMKTRPGEETPPLTPPADGVTRRDVAKSVAAHAALAGLGLLGSQSDPIGQKGDQQGSGTPSSSEIELWKPEDVATAQRNATAPTTSADDSTKDADIATSTKANVSGTKTSTISPTKVELPTVGPQGPNSPFTVVAPAEPKPAPAQAAPSTPPSPPKPPASATKPSGTTPGSGGTGTAGTSTGSGADSGTKVGTGTAGTSTTGTGTGRAPEGPPDSGSPYPMLRSRLPRTDEHRSVNKLVKEFKKFVDRKL